MRERLARLRRQVGALLHRRDVERAMDEEMQLHVEMEAEELMRAGLPADEARRRARVAFGGVERFKEAARDGRGTRWLEDLARDLHLAVRQLRAAPGFAVVAVLTLALGIGATTVVFSITNTVLLRPLPLPEPDRVLAVSHTSNDGSGGWGPLSAATYMDVAEQASSFADIGGYYTGPFNLSTDVGAEYLDGAVATAGLLEAFGARPMLGRLFTAEESRQERNGVVLLSYGLWQDHFGRDPDIVGRTVELNGRARTVVGVLPQDFSLSFPDEVRLWVPVGLTAEDLADRRAFYLWVIGRLKPHVTQAQADAEMQAIGARLAAEHPETDGRFMLRAHAVREKYIGVEFLRPTLLLMLGAVGCVLLIACANVASLQLARTAARRREVVLRAALGATRGRLIRQLLTESTLIALAGGAAGLLVAHLGVRLVIAAVPTGFPPWLVVGLDWRVLLFTAGVSMLTGVLFGVAPALGAGRLRAHEALKGGVRAGASRRSGRLRSALVTAQIALSLVLLVGATLLIQSFVRLQASRLGFEPRGALVATLSLAGPRYETPVQRAGFNAAVLERVQALPGVRSVTLVEGLAIANDGWWQSIVVDGEPTPDEPPRISYSAIAGDYFAAMGVPLVAGRVPEGAETLRADARVAVVNETMAAELWPNESPLGRRFRLENDTSATAWYTVIGVARDAIQQALGAPAEPQAFMTGAPRYTPRLVVRASSDRAAAGLAGPIRRAVAAIDPGVPLFETMLMRDVIERSESYWLPRLWSGLFTAFAALALTLAAVGLFGVISYLVRQRSHELSVRRALGAQRADVLRLVVGHGARLAAVGIVLGLLGAAAATRLLAGLLYGVEAGDRATFVAVPLVILGVALLACYLPARRAMRVDPAVALRAE